ncbi:MAG: Nif3-like dinuclear metal center hexameric protein [Candidatus Omnitrophica bacterium]|nr:Nif3-like dinuclear metal center hexameric protein [Candidatus Omnitrophota bacterium]
MKLRHLYEQVIKLGAECDPRRQKSKITFYPDTAILYGTGAREVKRVLIGIDIEVAELLLADRIRSRSGLDLVISHHPEGWAYASLYKVMQLQVDVLNKAGIPHTVAQKFLDERKDEVLRRLLPANHTRTVDAARLLDIPFICVHTPADNHAFWFMQRLLNKARPKKVKDILDLLLTLPEYIQARKESGGPQIILGNPNREAGKILVEMTGGTEGPKDIFDKLYKAGIRTLVSMHLSEEHFKKVKDANLNVVIAGHISSDTLGLNLLIDRLEKRANERLEVIGCSGFRRFSRN